MKTIVKIIAFMILLVGLNGCFLFGGGKSKCGDCPTWSHNQEVPNDAIKNEKA